MHTVYILGVAYIKFSKTSEAAMAMEEMNGKTLEGNPKPLKVNTVRQFIFRELSNGKSFPVFPIFGQEFPHMSMQPMPITSACQSWPMQINADL